MSEQMSTSATANITLPTEHTNSAKPDALHILCFGDSLTAGYHSYGWEHSPYSAHLQKPLEAVLPSTTITIDTAGQSGDQVQGGYLRRIQNACQNAVDDPYDWIIVMGGTNDLGWGRMPDEIYEGLQKVWKVALGTGANVLALNVLDSEHSGERLKTKRRALNELIANHKADRL